MNRQTQARDQTFLVFFGLWQERWSKLQSPITTAETTFLQQQEQQQRKQYQPEAILFNREGKPQLEVCMLSTQLTKLKVEFQTGKTKQYLCNWKHLTSDIEILHLPIELTDELVQTQPHHCSQQH